MKKLLVILLFLFVTGAFVLNPTLCINASKKGIMLWFNNIFPVLFPCIIVSNILLATNIVENKKKTAPVFIFLCGVLCGFPIGSKLSCDFYKKGIINQKTAQLLCNCSNHFSLAYISGFVMANCINDKLYNPFIVYMFIYLPSVMLLVINLPKLMTNEIKTKKSASRFNLNMQIIDAGIISGFETLIKLCGYIVLISITVELIMIQLNDTFAKYIIVGLLENTNGISRLIYSNLSSSLKMILAVGFVSFGGISCILQTASIINDTDLSIKQYIYAKIFTSIISLILTCIYLFGIRFS